MNTNENWSKFASANAASLVAKILNDAVVFQRWPHYQGNDDHVKKGKFVSLVNIEFTILTCFLVYPEAVFKMVLMPTYVHTRLCYMYLFTMLCTN